MLDKRTSARPAPSPIPIATWPAIVDDVLVGLRGMNLDHRTLSTWNAFTALRVPCYCLS